MIYASVLDYGFAFFQVLHKYSRASYGEDAVGVVFAYKPFCGGVDLISGIACLTHYPDLRSGIRFVITLFRMAMSVQLHLDKHGKVVGCRNCGAIAKVSSHE